MTESEFIGKTLSDASQVLLARYRGKRPTVLPKGGEGELVTEADTEMQDLIAAQVTAAFPRDHLVAEERDCHAPPADMNGRCWVLDPIDGTHNFIRGQFPVFGISLALVVDQVARAGGIALPGLGRLYLAERGCGAFLDGQRLAVTDTRSLNEADVELEFCRLAQRAEALRLLAGVASRAREILDSRSAVVALSSVAAGSVEAFCHPSLEVWDYAAGELIVTEAGGAVTRFDGSPVRLFSGDRTIVASNGHIHDQVLAALSERT